MVGEPADGRFLLSLSLSLWVTLHFKQIKITHFLKQVHEARAPRPAPAQVRQGRLRGARGWGEHVGPRAEPASLSQEFEGRRTVLAQRLRSQGHTGQGRCGQHLTSRNSLLGDSAAPLLRCSWVPCVRREQQGPGSSWGCPEGSLEEAPDRDSGQLRSAPWRQDLTCPLLQG